MSKQAVFNLIEESKADNNLLSQLKAAEDSSTILEIGKYKGYDFTEDELLSVMQEQQLSFANQPVELDEAALNFIKEVGNNQIWREDLESINTPADIVRYAAQKGYEFSEESIVAVMEHQQELTSQEGELSEDALEAIAGGCTQTTRSRDRSSFRGGGGSFGGGGSTGRGGSSDGGW